MSIIIGLLTYHYFIGSFNGVDGGIGLAASIIYLFFGLIIIGVLHLLKYLLRNHSTIGYVLVAVAWAFLAPLIIIVILYIIAG
jgi:hypothetical protein